MSAALREERIAVIAPPDSRIRASVERFIMKEYDAAAVNFFDARRPECLIAHGMTGDAQRLCSRLASSLSWQVDKRLFIVSGHADLILSYGERRGLIHLSLKQLRKKFPGVHLAGLLLGKDTRVLETCEQEEPE